MTNPKGTREETNAVKWFREHGWPYARRIVKAGARDEGDITLGDGVPVTIESKATKQHNLAGAMKELEVEIANRGDEFGFVILKKRGTTDPGQYYAVLPVARLNWLLRRAFTPGKSRRTIRRRATTPE